jgi:hypothetical protein
MLRCSLIILDIFCRFLLDDADADGVSSLSAVLLVFVGLWKEKDGDWGSGIACSDIFNFG